MLSFPTPRVTGIFAGIFDIIITRFNMKNLFSILFLLFALAVTTAQAQTVAITPSSLELIGTSAVTRSFYDLDDVYLKYKTGTITIYEAATGSQIFSGDTSEVTVTSASHWGAKAAKLTSWYQHVTKTDGYRYWLPKRGLQMVYKTSDTSVKLVHGVTKKLLISTALDSVKISGVTTVSNILTYLRGQYFLEGNRDRLGIGAAPTVATGAAAGTSPTATIAGTATDFKVTLTTGTTAASSGVLFTVTLPVTYPTGTIVTATNGDSDSALHAVRVFTTSTTSTVVLNATGAALSDATAYIWNFHVSGY